MNPLVRKSYDILGKDEVRRMNYHQSNIKREIIKRSNKTDDYKIASLIEDALAYHKPLPVAYAKDKLQEIYNLLEISRKAKATDLTTWFETQ